MVKSEKLTANAGIPDFITQLNYLLENICLAGK